MFDETKYMREWRKRHPENRKYQHDYQKQYYLKNREKILTQKKHYYQTEKGILVKRRASKKTGAKRKRNLGWIQMFENPFDESEVIEWHHITDAYVVAIPKDLHRLYLGKNHREKAMEIVKQIYLEK